jgi:hypothetical protein
MVIHRPLMVINMFFLNFFDGYLPSGHFNSVLWKRNALERAIFQSYVKLQEAQNDWNYLCDLYFKLTNLTSHKVSVYLF